MRIWAACKDPGGTAGLLPVVEELRKSSHLVELFAEGKACEILTEKGLAFTPFDSYDQFVLSPPFHELRKPDVFISDMSSLDGGYVAPQVIELMNKVGCPTVALQDTWGAGLINVWANPAQRPRYICVNDVAGLDIVLRAWPEFTKDRVIITGYPAMDKYADIDLSAKKREVMHSIGLWASAPLVLFCGQLEGSGESLMEIVRALNSLQADVALAARGHPRMAMHAPDEFTLWNKALESLEWGAVVDTSNLTTADVIAASTVTLSMFSIVLLEAALLLKPNIAMLYPETGNRIYQRDMGGLMPEYPLVQLGCTAKTTNSEQLLTTLREGLDGTLGLEKAQKAYLRVDGQSAKRVVQLIENLT